MPTGHVVKKGETLAKVAAQYGFADCRTIWDHPANRELASLRENPNVLAPGDMIVIPEKTEKTVTVETDRRYVVRVNMGRVKLRLVLRDFDHELLRNTKCTLSVEGENFELETDGDGLLECPITPTAETAELCFKDPLVPFDLTVPLRIGHLDPVDTVSGQAARLTNLGYYAGTGDDQDRLAFGYAVQEFQVDHDLPVSGGCDAGTLAKLREVHGC
jgi:hypothetical protein